MDRYQSALNFLYSFVSYEQKIHWDYNNKTLNLDRFRSFLTQLGNPQNSIKTIHVAGSDGKGSVCAMISTVLREMGYKTGLYISPHLENIRERIQINGNWISEEDFAVFSEYLEAKLVEHPPVQTGYATFFELMTAMAFLHFQKEKVDFAVIETGLGGRLDATNVMTPLVTVITHISKEHTAQLGDTLEQIADEKLGITRPAVPVIIGHQDQELLPHFRSRLVGHCSPPVFLDNDYHVNSALLDNHSRLIELWRENPRRERRVFSLPLLGHYQIQNAATSLAALDSLQQVGNLPSIPDSLLQKAMSKVRWAGRFEWFQNPGKPVTILDVAHTVKGAASLRMSLDELYQDRHFLFVIGFLEGKKIPDILQKLIRPRDVLILTKAPSPRGLSIEAIEKEAEGIISQAQIIGRIENPSEAYLFALSQANDNDIVTVSGSLYVVGDIRKTIFL